MGDQPCEHPLCDHYEQPHAGPCSFDAEPARSGGPTLQDRLREWGDWLSSDDPVLGTLREAADMLDNARRIVERFYDNARRDVRLAVDSVDAEVLGQRCQVLRDVLAAFDAAGVVTQETDQ